MRTWNYWGVSPPQLLFFSFTRLYYAMSKLRRGFRQGGQEPPEPVYFTGGLRDAGDHIRGSLDVEVLEPGQSGLGDKLGEYIRLRYGRRPESGSRVFQQSISAAMVERMKTVPMRFALLRYMGGDVMTPDQEILVKSDSVTAVNSSKQTFVYPQEYFAGLLEAEDKYSMDELTAAVMSPNSPHRFRGFTEIENLAEGPLKPGRGVGFLLLALVREDVRGIGLSQKLLAGVLRYYRDRVRVPYVFVYGRVPGLGADDEAANEFRDHGVVRAPTLNRYLRRTMEEGGDWGVGLHKKAGAHIICGLPDSVRDKDSLNCGYLGAYDLKTI